MTQRTIELSEKRHVEVVLYARGLELERDRMRELIRTAQQRLTAMTETMEPSTQQRDELRQVAGMLGKCL